MNFRFITALIFYFVSACLSAQDAPRQVINFNDNWRFKLGDYPSAADAAFDESNWEEIGLPHSFSRPYFMSSDFYTGYGWYRKHIAWKPEWEGKWVALEFEAAFQDAELFVNGQSVGIHKGGYTGFSFDVTPFLNKGENLIAVRLNNLWNPSLAPRAGEHVFSGGIYRDVYLVVTNPVHIAWYGASITTPLVSREKAAVKVELEIQSTLFRKKKILVQTDIIDVDGKKVGHFSKKYAVLPQGTTVVAEDDIIVSSPHLWHPDTPYRYKAVTRLYDGNMLLDEYQANFGIRDIQWTPHQGFMLNGERLYLRGANVHQDHAGWGDAVTNAGFYRDVKMIKEAGFNFIRGSHYPHDPAFVQACDSLGVLYWSENVFWGIGGSDLTPEGYWNSSAYPTMKEDRALFEQSLAQQLTEMIRIHRNSPSVIVWSMSNEPFFTAKSTLNPMRECLKKMVALSKKLDPTRPAAIGGAQRPLDHNRIDILGDVAGYNGDGGSLEVFQNPGIPNIVSEYGSTTSERPGEYGPGWGDIKATQGADVYPWRSGQAIWCGFDHGSIAGSALGKMGVIDYFRIPKRPWYYYRELYRDIPPPSWPKEGVPARIIMETDRTVASTDGTEDIFVRLALIDAGGSPVSNNLPVTLSVISGPGEFPTGKTITFKEGDDIRIQEGQAAIEIRSYYAGKSEIRATAPGLPPTYITLTFTGNRNYEYGKVAEVVSRPYSRFVNNSKECIVQEFGRNNPTFSSSSLKGHVSGLAADGDVASWWEAQPSDVMPYLILSTEKKLDLREMTLVFPVESTYQYGVDISTDGKEWTKVQDYFNSSSYSKENTIQMDGVQAGSVRIRFKSAHQAKIAEISIKGVVLD